MKILLGTVALDKQTGNLILDTTSAQGSVDIEVAVKNGWDSRDIPRADSFYSDQNIKGS